MVQLGRVVVGNHLVVAAVVAVDNNPVVVLGYKPVVVALDCTLAAAVAVAAGCTLEVQVVDNLVALVLQGDCTLVLLELGPLVADELVAPLNLECR